MRRIVDFLLNMEAQRWRTLLVSLLLLGGIIALFAFGKADVREELDRLAAHIAQARTLLAEARTDNPVGRKFDFLCQEFNREANTLCSKSADIELTRIGIDLKGAVERMREQVQNVE